MFNVLLSCVGRRQYLAEFFRQSLAGGGRVIGTDMDPAAPALAACDAQKIMASVFAEGYLENLKQVVRDEDVKLVFSLNDLEIGLLAANRDSLESETGAVFYVPPLKTLEICSDKWQTFQFASRLGLPTPATFLHADDALTAVAEGVVSFPLMVKPRWGSGSIALHRVGSEVELYAAFSECKKAVSGSILAPLGSVDAVIVQEFIAGSEFGLDVLYGKDETVIGFAAKRKIAMRAGETDKAVTVSPEQFEWAVQLIAENLPHRGNLDCDFLERDGRLFLLELNPRFGGGYPFTHLAGANHVGMLLDDFRGEARPLYSYQVGRAFSKYDTLVEVPAPPSR